MNWFRLTQCPGQRAIRSIVGDLPMLFRCRPHSTLTICHNRQKAPAHIKLTNILFITLTPSDVSRTHPIANDDLPANISALSRNLTVCLKANRGELVFVDCLFWENRGEGSTARKFWDTAFSTQRGIHNHYELGLRRFVAQTFL